MIINPETEPCYRVVRSVIVASIRCVDACGSAYGNTSNEARRCFFLVLHRSCRDLVIVIDSGS